MPEMSVKPAKTPDQTRVVVGMSGGVDSSVVAGLLVRQGYQVEGLFMKNWEEKDENGVCTSAKDWEDVQRVCDRLDIACSAVDFVKEYWDQVFSEFLEEYKKGYTPNPDVLCNREIKFKVFLNQALRMGADFLATGHYCRLGERDGITRLLKGSDPNKDQSYFLCMTQSAALSRTLFPVGDLPKPEVRRIAEELKLPTARKKDSTGICFIGERDFRPFLQKYLQAQPGDFRNLDGKKVGTHHGSAYYTLGQRKGLGLGGQGEPWFVVAKDHDQNIVYVERGTDHPALYSQGLQAEAPFWIAGSAPMEAGQEIECTAKVRYRQSDQACFARILPDGTLSVRFPEPQRAVTPGQSVVLYQGDECLGGAIIRQVDARL